MSRNRQPSHASSNAAADALGDALGITVRTAHTPEDRIALLAQAIDECFASGSPPLMYLGSALRAWLDQGGELDRDHLRVRAPRGNNQATPQRLFAKLQSRKPPHRG